MKKISANDEMKKRFEELLKNIYCMHCRKTVPIVDYDAWPDQGGIVVKGKCGLCGNELSRFVDMK